MQKLACLIVSRNLGDAVIQSGFLRELRERGYAEHYLVWTRPQVAFLYEEWNDCTVITSQFPVGTAKQFGFAAARRFFRAAHEIRRLAPCVTIDLIGDFRERLFARIAGSRHHLHIGWAPDHPFNRIIRNPFGHGQPYVVVPEATPNIYQAYSLMLEALARSSSKLLTQSTVKRANRAKKEPRRIGLHPFASQACKLWPDDRWRMLASALLKMGNTVIAFGAPNERDKLEQLFCGVEGIVLATDPLPVFANKTAELDLLIGLDSFSVHMAALKQVEVILINAGNHPALWAPPGGTIFSDSGGCKAYPCFNLPICKNSASEYACIKSVSVSDVMASAV